MSLLFPRTVPRKSGSIIARACLSRRAYSESVEASAIPHSFIDGLSYYWDTTAPTQIQLDRASRFFRSATPKLLYSTPTFRDVQRSELAEVAFFGRSNVGKSSTLNALMGRNICHTSSKPGRTRSMNYYVMEGKSGGKLGLMDMPGYGKGSHKEWGTEIVKYLKGRRQLKRAFLIIDPSHGLKKTDEQILMLFRNHAIPHQVMLSKIDRILFPNLKQSKSEKIEMLTRQNAAPLNQFLEQLRTKIQPGHLDGPEALGEVITCSAEATNRLDKFGINSLRWAVLTATGSEQERVRVERAPPSTILPNLRVDVTQSTLKRG